MQFLNRDLADERKEAMDKEKEKKENANLPTGLFLGLAKYKKFPSCFLVFKSVLLQRRN